MQKHFCSGYAGYYKLDPKKTYSTDGTELQLTATQMRGEATIRAGRRFRLDPLVPEGKQILDRILSIEFRGGTFRPPHGDHWKLTPDGLT